MCFQSALACCVYLLLHGGLSLLRLHGFLLSCGRRLLLLHLKQLLDLHLWERRRQHRPAWQRGERRTHGNFRI